MNSTELIVASIRWHRAVTDRRSAARELRKAREEGRDALIFSVERHRMEEADRQLTNSKKTERAATKALMAVAAKHEGKRNDVIDV